MRLLCLLTVNFRAFVCYATCVNCPPVRGTVFFFGPVIIATDSNAGQKPQRQNPQETKANLTWVIGAFVNGGSVRGTFGHGAFVRVQIIQIIHSFDSPRGELNQDDPNVSRCNETHNIIIIVVKNTGFCIFFFK